MIFDSTLIIHQANNYIADEQYEALVKLIETNAHNLIESQQQAQLLSLIDNIPDFIKFENDYILWLAVNISPLYVGHASEYFSILFEQYVKDNDYTQAYLAWTGYANVKFHYLDRFSDMLLWLKRADKLLKTCPINESDAGYAKFCTAYFIALLFVRPDKNPMKIWASKLYTLLNCSQNPYLKTNIYNHLILYYVWVGNMHQARLLHKEGLGIVYTSKHSPFYLAMHSIVFSMVDWLNLDHENTEKQTKIGIEYANTIHIKTWNVQIFVQNIYSLICNKEFKKAKVALAEMEQFKDSAQLLDNIQYHYLTGWLTLNSGGNLDDAHSHLSRALELAKVSGIVFIQGVIRICLAQVYFYQKKLPSAVSQLAQAQWIGRRMGSKHIRYGALLAQSYVMLVYKNTRLSSFYLKKALILAKKEQYLVIPGWHHDVMQQLLEKALHEGIQTSFVKRLILIHQIQPTENYSTHSEWPWQIKIDCLGEFNVYIKGEKQEKNRKIQKKPMELIQLLIWHNKNIAKVRVAQLLYPNEEADKAMQALNTTIFRARKILHNKKALIIEQENCLINLNLCHSDVIELKQLININTLQHSQYTLNEHITQIQILWQRTELSKNAMDPPWLIHHKNEIVQRIIEHLRLCTQSLSSSSKILLLKYILSLDETVETSYQDLITEYVAQGQTIEAKKVYLSCENNFAHLYSAKPSVKTRQLIKEES